MAKTPIPTTTAAPTPTIFGLVLRSKVFANISG